MPSSSNGCERAPQRHRTALKRGDLSRPILCALRDGLLTEETSLFDYGCGRGDDVARLSRRGYRCIGWDPVYRPNVRKRRCDVVNLGYVVNVIENPAERAETLRDAWDYARRLLVVSARLSKEARAKDARRLADGIVTRRGTFQKFFEQQELRDWIEATLSAQSVPAAPGIFYVFRSQTERESFLASRFRARHAAPRVRRSDGIYEANRDLLEPLAWFLRDRGRLPAPQEFPLTHEIRERIGSLTRAFRVIEWATGADDWRRVRETRSEELLLYLALARFSKRLRPSTLPLDLQLDVKAFFGSYKAASAQAEQMLFSAGNPSAVARACRESRVGKRAGPALYIHEAAIGHLPTVLRIYEGCARSYVGAVPEANIIKLYQDEPKVSYLSYPDFETDPHPALHYSLTVQLQTFRLRERDYSAHDNPPILHRKEEFLAADHPFRERFARLTRQEDRLGLLTAEPRRMGTRRGWLELLQRTGYRLRGHQIVRAPRRTGKTQ